MSVERLTYRGQGAYRPGLPARDIDLAELLGMAQVRKVAIDAIVEEAVGSGLYVAVLDGLEPEVLEAADAADPASSGEGDAAADEPDPLEAMLADPKHTSRDALKAAAEGLGLTVEASMTKAQIVEAIRAEQTRLADAADPASSGEGDQGGSTPGDDPGAEPSGEPGTPPAGEDA